MSNMGHVGCDMQIAELQARLDTQTRINQELSASAHKLEERLARAIEVLDCAKHHMPIEADPFDTFGNAHKAFLATLQDGENGG